MLQTTFRTRSVAVLAAVASLAFAGAAQAQGQASRLQQNAVKRCAVHQTAAERQACVNRIQGAGNVHTSGSVRGGGVLRSNTAQAAYVVPSRPRVAASQQPNVLYWNSRGYLLTPEQAAAPAAAGTVYRWGRPLN